MIQNIKMKVGKSSYAISLLEVDNMLSESDKLDMWEAWMRLRTARSVRRRRVLNPDINRRWKILQYLLERGAVDPYFAVRTREIADALGISLSNCSERLRRMRGSWVCRVGKKRARWFLSSKAIRFARQWGSFLRHPWIRR